MYNPPLLYDLHKDPGEIYTLNVKEYSDVMDKINQVCLYNIIIPSSDYNHSVH